MSRATLGLLSIPLAFVLFIWFTQSSRSAAPDHGDWCTDMYMVIAARNLNDDGFAKLHFTETLDHAHRVGFEPNYYISFPSTQAVLLGLLFRLGIEPPYTRLLPLCLVATTLLAVYLLGKEVFGTPWVGVAAALALSAELPFRLLADAYCYPSYDMPAKAWMFLLLTYAAKSSGRQRLGWMLAAALGSWATISFVGFEMIPAIGIYAFFCPLALGAQSRFAAIKTGFALEAVVVAACFVGLAQRIWLLSFAYPDPTTHLLAKLKSRSAVSEGLETVANDSIVFLVSQRVWGYAPWHLIVIGVGLAFWLLLPQRKSRLPAACWLLLVLVAELSWYVVFRQHSLVHNHTTHHLILSLCFYCAAALFVLWSVAKRSRALAGFLVAGCGFLFVYVLVASQPPAQFNNIYNNLVYSLDWSGVKEEAEEWKQVMPDNGVVVQGLLDQGPQYVYFWGGNFVNIRYKDGVHKAAPIKLNEAQRWFAHSKERGFPTFGRIAYLSMYGSLLEINRPPGIINAVGAALSPSEIIALPSRHAIGFSLGNGAPLRRAISLLPGPAVQLQLVFKNIKPDPVHVAADLIDADKKETKLFAGGVNDTEDVSVLIPERRAGATLRFSIADNMGKDSHVGVFPRSELIVDPVTKRSE